MLVDLLLNHSLHILFVLGGIFFLLSSFTHLLRIREYTFGSDFEGKWSTILAFLLIFLMGYFTVLYLISYQVDLTKWLQLMLSFIFFAGAVFVLYILRTVNEMLIELKESLIAVKALKFKQKEFVASIISLAKKKK